MAICFDEDVIPGDFKDESQNTSKCGSTESEKIEYLMEQVESLQKQTNDAIKKADEAEKKLENFKKSTEDAYIARTSLPESNARLALYRKSQAHSEDSLMSAPISYNLN